LVAEGCSAGQRKLLGGWGKSGVEGGGCRQSPFPVERSTGTGSAYIANST